MKLIIAIALIAAVMSYKLEIKHQATDDKGLEGCTVTAVIKGAEGELFGSAAETD